MEKEIDKLVSEFEGGMLTRRDLVRSMTMLSATAAAGAVLGIGGTAHAGQEKAQPAHDGPTTADVTDCTTPNADYIHTLVERIANTRFKKVGDEIEICLEQEVWDDSTGHSAWLFDGIDDAAGDRREAFARMADRHGSDRDDAMRGTFNKHAGRENRPEEAGLRSSVRTVLRESSESLGLGEGGKLLYQVLQTKIRIEQDSHSEARAVKELRKSLKYFKAVTFADAIKALDPKVPDYKALILCLPADVQDLLKKYPEAQMEAYVKHEFY